MPSLPLLAVFLPPNRFTPRQLLEKYTDAGLRYYVNPRTNDARWSPPKARGRGSSTVTSRSGGEGGADESLSTTSRGGGRASGLPPDWERKTTPAGRVYYVNHDLRITQWNPPPPGSAGEHKSSYPDQAPGPAPAPAGPFASAATAVVAPGGFGFAPAVPPQQSGFGFAQAVQPHQPPSARDAFDGSGGGGSGGGGARVGGNGSGGLPEHIDVRTNADGRTYYVNHRTKVTSWVPPPREDW